MKIVSNIPLFLFLLLSMNSFANPMNQILKSMVGENPPKIDGCQIDKEKWLNLMISRESFTQKITPNKNCEVEGEITPKIDEFFSLNLKVLNHKDLKSITSQAKASILFEEQAILRIDIKDAKIIKAKTSEEFSLYYKFAIDPFSEKSFIQKKLDAEITLKGQSPKKL